MTSASFGRGQEDLELFVWHLNGVEYRVEFTLEVEREGFLPFFDVGITNVDGRKNKG